MPKYTVPLSALAIVTAEVQVDAEDEQAAIDAAIKIAETGDVGWGLVETKFGTIDVDENSPVVRIGGDNGGGSGS